MHKKLLTAILITLCIVFLPLTTLAQSDGIPLQKDVFLDSIPNLQDFVSTLDGATFLSAISMRLQVIGESVKRIQKKDLSLLNRYAEIEWDKIARFRDLVSHHYEHVDHEIVYDICQNHIPRLKDVIEKMIKGLLEMESLLEA